MCIHICMYVYIYIYICIYTYSLIYFLTIIQHMFGVAYANLWAQFPSFLYMCIRMFFVATRIFGDDVFLRRTVTFTRCFDVFV